MRSPASRRATRFRRTVGVGRGTKPNRTRMSGDIGPEAVSGGVSPSGVRADPTRPAGSLGRGWPRFPAPSCAAAARSIRHSPDWIFQRSFGGLLRASHPAALSAGIDHRAAQVAGGITNRLSQIDPFLENWLSSRNPIDSLPGFSLCCEHLCPHQGEFRACSCRSAAEGTTTASGPPRRPTQRL